MGRKRTTDKYDIVVTNSIYRNGLYGSIRSSHFGKMNVELENGETVDLKHSQFDYLSELYEEEK